MRILTHSFLISLSAFSCAYATNGDNFISLGVASRGMGGTGISHYSAGASATGNPALITRAKGGEFTFGGTYLSPKVKVKTENTPGGLNDLESTSDAKKSTTPYAALSNNLDNGFSIGGSMYGAAGMGTDWTAYPPNAATSMPGLYAMESSLTMLKLSAPIAYRYEEFSIGIAPVMLFGTLEMSYIGPSGEVGEDPSSDTGFGYEVGLLYFNESLGLSLGAVYHSPIYLSYEDQLSTVSEGFGYGTPGANIPAFSDALEQPAELGVGVDFSYQMVSISADYRRIFWAEASGYSGFNWQNQDVYSLGLELRIDELALRTGYNYGKNPIQSSSDTTIVNPLAANSPQHGHVLNTFNHVMFPAVTQSHYTFGIGYQFSGGVSADLALVYATSPDVTVPAYTTALGDITVSNDQLALSAALNIVF